MRISLQLGVHCTDDGRLIRSVLRSRGLLIAEGIHVPSPRHYRSVLRDSLSLLAGAEASDDVQQAILDAIVDTDGVRRLVLFHENLIALPNRAITDDGLYAGAPRRLTALQNLFPDHEVEFHIALCNPATLIPTLALRAGPGGYEQVRVGTDPDRLSWLRTVQAILGTNPELPLTLWCNEDTPLIWPEVIRAVTGYRGADPLDGDLDLPAALLSDEGLASLQASFAADPPATVDDRRARVSDVLASHGRAEEMEIEAAVPGWTDETVAGITERYVADCAAIARLPGVNFIAP